MEVNDADMAAGALLRLGDVARRQGRYAMSLRLIQSAGRFAAILGCAPMQSRYWRTLARTHAEMGARAKFDEAIDLAVSVGCRDVPTHDRCGDNCRRKVLLEKGQGLTLLGNPSTALDIYDQVIPLLGKDERERGNFAILQAQALAHAGHLEAGVSRAIDGLDLARRYGSPRHVSRVTRMHDRLAHTWSASEPAMRTLRDALAS
jgi:tetratricopeptide (TPR) repeat protein